MVDKTSCSNQLLHSKKKQGGTVTMASGRWIPRKVKSGADSKGRWSYITLKGKGTRKVTFITAYRVCQQKSIGTCTISKQQQNDFIESGEFGVNLRKRLITEFFTPIYKYYSHRSSLTWLPEWHFIIHSSLACLPQVIYHCSLDTLSVIVLPANGPVLLKSQSIVF